MEFVYCIIFRLKSVTSFLEMTEILKKKKKCHYEILDLIRGCRAWEATVHFKF